MGVTVVITATDCSAADLTRIEAALAALRGSEKPARQAGNAAKAMGLPAPAAADAPAPARAEGLPKTAQERVIELLQTNGPMSTTEIVKSLEGAFSSGSAYQACTKLYERGRIKRENDGSGIRINHFVR